MADRNRIGVGILGAGPVTQAIHLPTLVRLNDTFRVVRIMDVDASVAEAVAARVHADWTTSQAELLDDPAVEVVAICSPHPFHADQVIAACRAGKKAVLCEKPFAVSAEEAARIAEVSEQTGVPVVVGAMHAYDAGWIAAMKNSGDLAPHTVRSSIVLPPNSRFEDFATEVVTRPAPFTLDLDDPDAVAGVISGGILGLAIHDLPLIRQLVGRVGSALPADVTVLRSETVYPFGYLVVLEVGGVLVELHAAMSENWAPSWHLTAFDDVSALDVEFTPSYVQAGSSTATFAREGRTTISTPTDDNGYEREWIEIGRVARGATPVIPASVLIDDLAFALDVADKASSVARAAVAERTAA
ncbi:Gfo/Idh/MocA family protein [Humibacter soli]